MLVAACTLALAVALLGAGTAHAQAEPIQILLFHEEGDARAATAVTALEELGAANDFDVVATDDPADFTEDNLAAYRAVVFFNTSGNLLDEAQEIALEDYLDEGNGFLGIGEAAEAEPGTPFFNGLIGARPNNTSNTTVSTRSVVAGDRFHPSTAELPLQMQREDIWYTWAQRPTGQVHTVARHRAPAAPAGDGTNVGGTDHPISWCRDFGGGRSFYTGMGRTAASFAEDELRAHLLGAVQWTAGLLRGNCKATINSNYQLTRLTQAGATATGLDTHGENHGLVVAPNGWVIYIGRADCRTDAERGNVFETSAFGRVFDFASPNVGAGCGSVHVWDPGQHNGDVNSGVTRAGVLAVHGDMGQGGERANEPDHKIETGLLGIALSPDFMQTGHIYLMYFPSFNPDTLPPGLSEAQRISKMAKARVSRFTMDLDTKQLDLDSEVRIFEYDSQVFSCCHRGGGMGFDSEGNLYITTGDSNSSQGTSGYSGNNQLPKCPEGAPNQASSAHCGDANYSYQDARRTAGNTNDYNGKMLRFNPIEGIPDGTQPPVGRGSTYTLPGENSPNGPNLFSGTEGNGSQAKPEIYAMGLRNPSRLSIDPETDTPYSAWVGPDAQSPSQQLGPSTYESAAQITRAGNYGWPYCMGNKQAYRDRTNVLDPNDPDPREPTGTPRATNEGGYVNGGPAGAPIPGWYDCDNIVNDSVNNTGLAGLLPHTTGTGMDAGAMRPVNVWYSRGNPGGNGCPDFPRPNGAPDYGANATQLCPYATANGATIMNGPLYRYDEGATDNSRRWPEYWDGRWFLFDQGGNSIKHGLMLDPATDQAGGQPIWADSLRGIPMWNNGGYMDSKFGPDGALYVLNYEGFFRVGANNGLFRVAYTGGPSTPGANPRGVAIGDNRVRFSSTGSGGVSYRWEFGDGQTSTEANPVHQYAAPGARTATLTVTYSDDETSTKDVQVNVLAAPDTIAPTTTAHLSPTQPGPGGTYNVPVTVTLAPQDQGGTGIDETEYSVNGAPFREYTGPFAFSEPDDYVIRYRSVDNAGNEEPTKTVTFSIELIETCEPALSDEFNGAALSDAWEVLREDETAISLSDGRLNLEVRAGDMLGGGATAKNVLLKRAPAEGNWTATTRFDPSQLTAEGQQAGLILWESEDPNNFAKIVFINKGTFRQFEYYTTENNSPGRLVIQQISDPSGDVYLRARSNGAGTVFPEYSFDGNEWRSIGPAITELSPDIKVGLKVSDNENSDAAARFEYFRVDCTDQIAPVTTATLDPALPDGRLGWYSSEPTVTLTADDGEGDGVARIEYAIDDGEFQPYDAPFKVTGVGEHTVRYRATDRSPFENQEEIKSLTLRVDPQSPSTTAEVDGTGDSRTVTLDAGDGSGSGVQRTEYRVDGGSWQTYDGPPAPQAIFDGTQASLDRWAQAGPGGFTLQPDGSIQSQGGLGMLWYPVTDYGDFSLRFQWRDARTDGVFSNGGVFARFPHPDETVAQPLAERPNCADGTQDPAWVAIFCGHEIQMYDGPTGEPQKTGSIYNFDSLNLAQARPVGKGEWTDYELRIVGQKYMIIRDGVVINEFDNSIPRDSSRGGDPPTQARQFARGYVGFQNHGGSDVVQIRNVQVQDLGTRAGNGRFTVRGPGNHTIEYRSLDEAGNVEATRSVTFRIGQPAPPPPPTPVGDRPEDVGPPAQPRRAMFVLGPGRNRMSISRFTRRGLRVSVHCSDRMQGRAQLRVSRKEAKRLRIGGRRTIASRVVRCEGAETETVTLKVKKTMKRKLRRYDRRFERALRATVRVTMKASFQDAVRASEKVRLG